MERLILRERYATTCRQSRDLIGYQGMREAAVRAGLWEAVNHHYHHLLTFIRTFHPEGFYRYQHA